MLDNLNIYRVRLQTVKQRIGHYNNEIFVFTFQVIEPDSQLRPLESWMEKRISYRNKVDGACRALMGRCFDIFKESSISLIGKECYVKVDGRKIIEFLTIAEYEEKYSNLLSVK